MYLYIRENVFLDEWYISYKIQYIFYVVSNKMHIWKGQNLECNIFSPHLIKEL